MAPSESRIPSLDHLRTLTKEKTGYRPCLFQLKFAQAILKGDRDVLLEAGCGHGKTLGFWIPLFYKPTGIQLVVTALNLLGKQNVETLKKAGIRAISIDSESANSKNFTVEYPLLSIKVDAIDAI
jgi:superfamily II DNA helicase RecQ